MLHVFKGVNRIHPASRSELLRMLNKGEAQFQFFAVRVDVYLAVSCSDTLLEQLTERFPRMEPLEAIPAEADTLIGLYFDRF